MITWKWAIFIIIIVNFGWVIGIRLRNNAALRKIARARVMIERMIDGDREARLSSDSEGDLAKLFHGINSLADVLGAHADNRKKTNIFLKHTVEDISHQLKTPLAALNIYIGILQDENISGGERKKFVNLAEKELERMETLIQNLLKLTRIDSGNVHFSIKAESVAEMLLEVCERFSVRVDREKKKIRLETDDIVCACDRVWTTEALCNIVKNALDHTEEGNEIVLKCGMSGGDVCFSIEDNGTGIHEDDLYYIFNRFYRSRHSNDGAGIGLGLPLTKAIIENQKGIIEVESQLGKGTVFSVYLPIPTKVQD